MLNLVKQSSLLIILVVFSSCAGVTGMGGMPLETGGGDITGGSEVTVESGRDNSAIGGGNNASGGGTGIEILSGHDDAIESSSPSTGTGGGDGQAAPVAEIEAFENTKTVVTRNGYVAAANLNPGYQVVAQNTSYTARLDNQGFFAASKNAVATATSNLTSALGLGLNTAWASEDTDCDLSGDGVQILDVNEDGTIDPTYLEGFVFGDDIKLSYLDPETCETSSEVTALVESTTTFINNIPATADAIAMDGNTMYVVSETGTATRLEYTEDDEGHGYFEPVNHVLSNYFEGLPEDLNQGVTGVSYDPTKLAFVLKTNEKVEALDIGLNDTECLDNRANCVAEVNMQSHKFDSDGCLQNGRCASSFDGCKPGKIKARGGSLFINKKECVENTDDGIQPVTKDLELKDPYNPETPSVLIALAEDSHHTSTLAYDVVREDGQYKDYVVVYKDDQERVRVATGMNISGVWYKWDGSNLNDTVREKFSGATDIVITQSQIFDENLGTFTGGKGILLSNSKIIEFSFLSESFQTATTGITIDYEMDLDNSGRWAFNSDNSVAFILGTQNQHPVVHVFNVAERSMGHAHYNGLDQNDTPGVIEMNELSESNSQLMNITADQFKSFVYFKDSSNAEHLVITDGSSLKSARSVKIYTPEE